MRRYDLWSSYPYNRYGNAIVLKRSPSADWMDQNLVASQEKWDDNDGLGEPVFVRHMVGFQSWKTEDGLVMMSFHDPENRRRVIELLPDLVVEADPFGPDCCPRCDGRAPTFMEWWHGFVRVFSMKWFGFTTSTK